jgi:hypothetical protein
MAFRLLHPLRNHSTLPFFLFLQEQIKHIIIISVRALLSKDLITPTSHQLSNLCAMCLPCVCVCDYYCRTYYKAVRVGEGWDP